MHLLHLAAAGSGSAGKAAERGRVQSSALYSGGQYLCFSSPVGSAPPSVLARLGDHC